MIEQYNSFAMGKTTVSWTRLYQAGVYWVTLGDWPIVVYLDAVIDDFGALAPVSKPLSHWRHA